MIINITLPHKAIKNFTTTEANQYVTNNLEKILHVTGVYCIHPGPTINPIFMWTVFMTHSLLLSFIIMLFSDSSISAKLEGLCLCSIVYQGVHKMYTAVVNPNYFIELFKVVDNLHQQYINDIDVAPILKKICLYCMIIFESLFILFVLVAFAYTALPLLIWINSGQLTTVFPIQYPFIDWHTAIGYTINLVNHLFIVLLGLTGLVSADIVFVYFVLHTIGYLQVLKSRINKLDIMLEDDLEQNLHKIKKQFNECIKAHQDYITYIKSVDSGFAQLCMIQLITSTLILTTALFLTLWSKWIVGPFTVLAGLFQLLQYCLLGTVVTFQNDRASDVIYGMKWYLLPVNQQKLVVLMLLRANSPAELNVGDFAKLNVETCMQVLKTTYSYLMMMLKFIS